jgi:F420-dependent oxidoreductase-like protein
MRTLITALIIGLVLAPRARAQRPVEFGIQTPQETASFDDLVAAWQEGERLGFTNAWLYDHFIPITGSKDGPDLEGWTALAALAGKTTTMRIGILVTGNTYRYPALLAKMATTVDHISNGRLEFGIGAGWFEFEHTAYGIPFYTDKERADRLAEALEVIRLLWTGDHPTFDGRFYDLVKAPFAPKNVQTPHPPIVIGGQGKKWIMPTVARYATEWNVPIGLSPDDVKERMELLRRECARIGRTPCVERVSILMPLINISNVPLAGPATRLGARLLVEKRIADSLLAGSPDEIKDRIRRYVDAGITRVILSLRPPFNRDLMRRFAAEVMPAFQPAAGAPAPERSGPP